MDLKDFDGCAFAENRTLRRQGSTLVPLLRELLLYVKAVHEESLSAADNGKPLAHVVTIEGLHRVRYSNRRTQLERIIRRGVEP